MNAAEIIQSKQKLEEEIKSLITDFKRENNLSDVQVDTLTRNIYTDGSIGSFRQIVDVVVTAKVNELGAEIIIK